MNYYPLAAAKRDRIRIAERSTAKHTAEMKPKPMFSDKQQKTKRVTEQEEGEVTDVVSLYRVKFIRFNSSNISSGVMALLKTTEVLTNSFNVHVYVSWVTLAWKMWGSCGEFEPILPVLWDAGLSPLWTLCPSFSQSDTAGIIPLFPHESSSDRPLSGNKAFGYAVWWPKPRGMR